MGILTALLVCAPAPAVVLLDGYDGQSSIVLVRSAVGGGATAPHDMRISPIQSLPFATSHSALLDGWSTSADYALDQTSFAFSFTQLTGSASGAYTNAQGALYFKVTKDTPYTIAGGHQITDEGDPVESATHVFLQDLSTPDGFLFVDRDRDVGVTPWTGSATGLLVPNRTYLFNYHFEIFHTPSAVGRSSAIGTLSLTIPEPGTAAVPACMLLLFAARSRRAAPRV